MSSSLAAHEGCRTVAVTEGPAGVLLLRADLARYVTDPEGRAVWWFGSEPPGGIPQPKVLLQSIAENLLRSYAPPWAVVAKDPVTQTAWICTDPIGFHHLFVRSENGGIVVSSDAFAVASRSKAHVDAVGVYELLARGNPQGGRTLFREVRCLGPAHIIRCGREIKEWNYWYPPDPSPLDEDAAVERYANAVKEAVLRHYRLDDAQELTAGRDSLMILSVLVSENVPVRTWTHGWRGSVDLAGAQRRAQLLGVQHQAVPLEPLESASPEEAFQLVKTYLLASGGLANAVRYGMLPWVLQQVEAVGSVTGVGGEVFRGFYHEWAGRGRFPRRLGQWLLLHGKVRAEMPFASGVINPKVAKLGDEVIRNDVLDALRPEPHYWHALDVYYLMHRMHHFSGTTFSATGLWRPVRTPLFDSQVLDCLHLIPNGLRDWSGGLVKAVTMKMLKNTPVAQEKTFSYETLGYRLRRLASRTKQLRGSWTDGFPELFARTVLGSEEAARLLDAPSMITGALYDTGRLMGLIKRVREGAPIPEFLGAILTVEMAAREIGPACAGVELP